MRKAYRPAGAVAPASPADLASALVYDKRKRLMATANSGTPNVNVSDMPIGIDIDPLMKDIVFSEDLEQKKLVMRIYTDIYYNYAIAGSIVDIKANLMFSDFTLGGILDRRVASVFQENVDRLDLRTLMPDIAIDYNVKGGFVGSLLYNEKTRVFSRIMPHGYENTKVDPLPFHGTDPLLTVAFPEYIRTTMQSDSPRIKALRDFLGPTVMQQLNEEALELDPKSTVYCARTTGSTTVSTSYYRRILPWYLLYKNLFRGTLVRSAARQKGLLHITLDGGGEWEPTTADMNMVLDMFMAADADPIMAAVATRSGISTEEIRDPSGGWTIFDNVDAIDTICMKALGISDAFLSGESTYSNSDNATSFFIDSIRNERDFLTRKVLYNKIFPMISALNGYVLSANGKLSTRGNSLDKLDPLGSGRLQDGSRLLVPSVHWEKTLKPEGDSSYMDMLQSMTDKGVPVPLRAMAAAGGFNLDRLLADQEGDLFIQERVYQYQKSINDLKKKYGISDEAASSFASALMYDKNAQSTASDVLARNNGHLVGLASRDFGEKQEVAGITHDGKKRYLHNQKLANERANRKIVKMVKELERKGQTHVVRSTTTTFR